jgi:hypothetical protein
MRLGTENCVFSASFEYTASSFSRAWRSRSASRARLLRLSGRPIPGKFNRCLRIDALSAGNLRRRAEQGFFCFVDRVSSTFRGRSENFSAAGYRLCRFLPGSQRRGHVRRPGAVGRAKPGRMRPSSRGHVRNETMTRSPIRAQLYAWNCQWKMSESLGPDLLAQSLRTNLPIVGALVFTFLADVYRARV